MTFQCSHRGFAVAVNDPNHGYLGRGIVLSNTQSSKFVRPFAETHCNGFEFAPGRLRDFDLGFFNGAMPPHVAREVRARSETSGLIVYRFFHWHRRTRIEHGWLVTTRDHRFLRSFVTGPTAKSTDVVARTTDAILRGA